MAILNSIVWDILSEDEKMALSLQHGFDKSSWESGEVMEKSHYKYLEIKYRADKFLKMFTEHLELYDKIIPDYITGDKVVIRYFDLCLSKRLKTLDAVEELQKEFGKIHKAVLNEKIINTLKEWENGSNAYNLTIFHLIKEFDRWNNFRILPKELQEPSAYKRRVKNTYKKHIKNTCSIHPLAIEKIVKLHGTNKAPMVYVPIINQGNPEMLKLKNTVGCFKVLNIIGLYAFSTLAKANEYLEELHDYTDKGKKECIDGLNFWPKYREIIKTAINYEPILKISPSRKYLQYAMQKLNFV